MRILTFLCINKKKQKLSKAQDAAASGLWDFARSSWELVDRFIHNVGIATLRGVRLNNVWGSQCDDVQEGSGRQETLGGIATEVVRRGYL